MHNAEDAHNFTPMTTIFTPILAFNLRTLHPIHHTYASGKSEFSRKKPAQE